MRESNIFNSLVINLTNKCNLKCLHCFQCSAPKETAYISAEQVYKILDYFELRSNPQKPRYVQFTGGEIFLHEEIYSILKYCIEKKWILRLQTNGTVFKNLTSEKVTVLRNIGRFSSFRVSLDGWNDYTHEFLRPKGSFENVLKGIK